MANLQDLMAAAQRAGVGGAPPVAGGLPPQGGMPPAAPIQAAPPMDPQAQLMQLLSGAASGPQGGQTLQAIQQLMAGAGGNGGGDGQLNSMATAQAGDPRMMAMPGGGTPENRGAVGIGPGPATDQDLTDMLDASDSVRSDLPPAKRDGYTGGDDSKPFPVNRSDGSQKVMSTEEELADVQKKMGGEDGPPQADIKALQSGKMTPAEFEKMHGKGSASDYNDDAGYDDGDHEYR